MWRNKLKTFSQYESGMFIAYGMYVLFATIVYQRQRQHLASINIRIFHIIEFCMKSILLGLSFFLPSLLCCRIFDLFILFLFQFSLVFSIVRSSFLSKLKIFQMGLHLKKYLIVVVCRLFNGYGFQC